MSEARALTGEDACVVGGGNSAGQAAMHLAQFAESVTIVVRSDTLAASMSDYLVKSIDRTPNINIRFETDVVDGGGEGRLEWLDLKDRRNGATERVPAAALFILIGADPCTDWLPASVQRDAWGYIATGGHCDCHVDVTSGRAPLMFETTMLGSLRGRRRSTRFGEARCVRCGRRRRVRPAHPRLPRRTVSEKLIRPWDPSTIDTHSGM